MAASCTYRSPPMYTLCGYISCARARMDHVFNMASYANLQSFLLSYGLDVAKHSARNMCVYICFDLHRGELSYQVGVRKWWAYC